MGDFGAMVEQQDGARNRGATANARSYALSVVDWVAVLPALLFTAIVYGPIVDNYFTGDDFLNLYRIVNMPFGEYLFTPHGGHTLPFRNFLFYVTAAIAGPSPAPFLWTVLITHLLNVALLFVVIRTLTGGPLLAGFGALLWGTCPIHEGTLGWYSVYGQVVAVTALLVMLVLLSRAGAQGRAPSRGALATCYVLALLAMMSFGVGMGIAMALPFVVVCLAPAARDPRRWGPPLRSLLVVVPAGYVGFFWLHGLMYEEGLETPVTLLKYAAELWSAWIPGVIYLVAYGTLREVTSFAFNPVWFTTASAYATVGLVVLWSGWSAWRGPIEARRTLAACTLLVLGCYGFIAAGRAAFFEGFTSQLMAAQPRYHYAALVPVTVILCVLLKELHLPTPNRPAGRMSLFATAVGIVALLYADFGPRIDHYPLAREQVETVLSQVRAQAETESPGAVVYIPNRAFAGFFVSPPPDFPGWAAIFAIFNDSPVVAGQRIFFTDHRPEVVAAARKGRRSAGLVVSAPERPSPTRSRARPAIGPNGGPATGLARKMEGAAPSVPLAKDE